MKELSLFSFSKVGSHICDIKSFRASSFFFIILISVVNFPCKIQQLSDAIYCTSATIRQNHQETCISTLTPSHSSSPLPSQRLRKTPSTLVQSQAVLIPSSPQPRRVPVPPSKSRDRWPSASPILSEGESYASLLPGTHNLDIMANQDVAASLHLLATMPALQARLAFPAMAPSVAPSKPSIPPVGLVASRSAKIMIPTISIAAAWSRLAMTTAPRLSISATSRALVFP